MPKYQILNSNNTVSFPYKFTPTNNQCILSRHPPIHNINFISSKLISFITNAIK